jgi:hypothetical protein
MEVSFRAHGFDIVWTTPFVIHYHCLLSESWGGGPKPREFIYIGRGGGGGGEAIAPPFPIILSLKNTTLLKQK